MTKLNDIQTILLSGAVQRQDGSLLPLPVLLIDTGADRIGKAVAGLIKGGYASEKAVTAADQTWRVDGEWQYGAVITDAGRIAIGVEPVADSSAEHGRAVEPAASADADRPTKAEVVLSLLQREHGATLAELIEATGWLPHTTRAALTGIRKKGHDLTKGKRGDVTCYTLAA